MDFRKSRLSMDRMTLTISSLPNPNSTAARMAVPVDLSCSGVQNVDLIASRSWNGFSYFAIATNGTIMVFCQVAISELVLHPWQSGLRPLSHWSSVGPHRRTGTVRISRRNARGVPSCTSRNARRGSISRHCLTQAQVLPCGTEATTPPPSSRGQIAVSAVSSETIVIRFWQSCRR